MCCSKKILLYSSSFISITIILLFTIYFISLSHDYSNNKDLIKAKCSDFSNFTIHRTYYYYTASILTKTQTLVDKSPILIDNCKLLYPPIALFWAISNKKDCLRWKETIYAHEIIPCEITLKRVNGENKCVGIAFQDVYDVYRDIIGYGLLGLSVILLIIFAIFKGISVFNNRKKRTYTRLNSDTAIFREADDFDSDVEELKTEK